MSNSLHNFLAKATAKAAADLEAAFLRLPEDKRDWSAGGTARTALDMIAECAILNGSAAGLLVSRVFPPNFDFAAFALAKTELAQDKDGLLPLLHANANKAIEVIRTVPVADLDIEIAMPWGPITVAECMSYPYWNMAYHEGQINFIASILGCLP